MGRRQSILHWKERRVRHETRIGPRIPQQPMVRSRNIATQNWTHWIPSLGIILGYLLLHPSHIGASSLAASDSTLARRFAPIVVLTKNPERLDRKVLNPEPVEIIGANSISSIWMKVTAANASRAIEEAQFPDWQDLGGLREREGNVSFLSKTVPSEGKFAFLRNAGWYYTIGPDLIPGNYRAHSYFDYPGDDEESWDRAYFPGSGEDDSRAGWRFPNTVYAHVFERPDPTDGFGSVVITYFLFFPYNDWQNNHEGDWQKVNIIVTSRNPAQAQLSGIDYMFHGKSISYYDITDSPSTTNPRVRIPAVGGEALIVYVSAGGHGLYPTPGDYVRAGKVTYDDNLTGQVPFSVET